MKQSINYCPVRNSNTHSYKDYSYWSGENHPTCEDCGYIDRTRGIHSEPTADGPRKLTPEEARDKWNRALASM